MLKFKVSLADRRVTSHSLCAYNGYCRNAKSHRQRQNTDDMQLDISCLMDSASTVSDEVLRLHCQVPFPLLR